MMVLSLIKSFKLNNGVTMTLETLESLHSEVRAEATSSIGGNTESHPLDTARADAASNQLPYAGRVLPTTAWQLIQNKEAVLVDVRTAEERKFVGYVPESLHVPWATGTSLNRNPRFVKELENKVGGKDVVVLLLCRSGNRSAAAAEAAHVAGFQHVFNIAEGFEGDLDAQAHRGSVGGWRFYDLPWIQD
jgi:rhodanese-related sulfurtransferase